MKSSPVPVVSGLFLALSTISGFAAPGSVEMAFNPNVNDHVTCMVPQVDGTIIIAGQFTTVGGVPRNHIARLHAGGTLDTEFDPDANNNVSCVLVQADHRIIVAGSFTAIAGTDRAGLVRLHADGSLDAGFNPALEGSVQCAAMQPDGKILITGQFWAVGGVNRPYAARLHADGTLDTGFNPNPTEPGAAVAVQPDGKILLGGGYGIRPAKGIVRFHADGAVDAGFNPSTSTVIAMALQTDGKIVIGGFINQVNGVARNNIARLNANGTLDTAFNPNINAQVGSLALQADGKILVGGSFSKVGGVTRHSFARLRTNGTLDTAFNPNVPAHPILGGSWSISSAVQPNGKILIGGFFTTVGGAARANMARLDNDPPAQSLTASVPGRVQWLRGGGVPEVEQVTFDLSTGNGGAWTALGTGKRINGGWELAGLDLPPVGQLRARARTTGGYRGASAGLVESVIPYSATPLQFWRKNHFDTFRPDGLAADDADPDQDGLGNLVEYAFALNPHAPDAAALPGWRREGDEFVCQFEVPAGVSGISYNAESSTNLTDGSWTPVPNTAVAPAYDFRIPASPGQRLFLRVRVAVAVGG